MEFANHHDQTHNVEDRYKSLIDWYLFKLYSILFSAIFPVGWVCVYMYCHWRSGYQEGMVVILLTHLTQQHYCACNNPGPVCRGPPLFVLSEWRWEAIDRFVDIGGIFIPQDDSWQYFNFNNWTILIFGGSQGPRPDRTQHKFYLISPSFRTFTDPSPWGGSTSFL